jgi:predicted methyltransferase MtxX (methanogen marker protein 4)
VNENDEEAVDRAMVDAAKRGSVTAAKVVLSKVKRTPKQKRSRATELAAEPEWKGGK